MTAAAVAVVAQPARRWAPLIAVERYDRRPELSASEQRVLGRLARRVGPWPAGAAEAIGRLTRPIDDVLSVAGCAERSWRRSPTRGDLLAAMAREGVSLWGFDRRQWQRTIASSDQDVRGLVILIAYQCSPLTDLHWGIAGFKCGLFAARAFGPEAVDASLDRVRAHLDELGYSAQLRRPNLQRALLEMMLAARSPLLEDLARRSDLLVELHAREQNNARRHGVEQLARTLLDMGLLDASPFAVIPSREEWLGRARGSEREVPAAWLAMAQRWFATATAARATREGTYFSLIKCGRWIAAEHPEHADPASWTRQTAAAWVDQMLVGEFSHAPNTAYMRRRSGGPLSPRTKAGQIWTLRRFFLDLQEWEWIERRFDPRRALELPRSIRNLIGPNPRVISDEIWAKLMWAGLNLTEQDLPVHATTCREPWYPLAMVRAVAVLWLFAGPRSDEILRLRVGATRSQAAADGRVCLLAVPTNKTTTVFTKPVDPLVGDAIAEWEALRPDQPPMVDPKTAEQVDFLFCFRGARLSSHYLNRALIPLLCRKAGVPRDDVKGPITGHRARATIATQLYNAKDPMSLFELQAWLGHSSPSSTQHYAKITPLTLTRAYQDAGYFGRNLRTIEVLLDRDAITNGTAASGSPFEFYDLGHGYCTYSFFEQCPHRMACARCDFYLPKESSAAQLLEAKDSLQRMLVQVPLTEAEQAAVEGDGAALEALLDRLTDLQTPAGPTRAQLRRQSAGDSDGQTSAREGDHA